MCLEYSCKVSIHLDIYNFIYWEYSPNYSVLYILFRVKDFLEVEDDLDKVLNLKVVEEYETSFW